MGYVLIIDNDQIIRSVLADKFKQLGVSTQQAATGQEGLDKAKQEHPTVIILDEHMPQMTGQQFMEALQQEAWFKDVHIIVFTALHDIDLVNHKMMAGVKDYLDKGASTPDSVVAAAQKYLQA